MQIPLISGQRLSLTLKVGSQLFIVGANGSGKSALIQYFVSSNTDKKVRRVSAHRQTWFASGGIGLTPQARKNFEVNRMHSERETSARWLDHYSGEWHMAILFDLVAKENERARHITRCHDAGKVAEAQKISAESKSPFERINKLLELGSLAITLELFEGEDIRARHKDVSEMFSIEKMSDGERNAVIIAATVLTVESGTLLLIDEPERHLHRAIIEPFLSALFEQRKDCAFVISTHEIELPLANPEAQALMVRSCRWQGDNPSAWDAELLEANVDLPEDLKRAILGSRKKILFVEGEPQSLDLPLYNSLFPGISVVSKGGCGDVIKAVKGLRNSESLHYVEGFGLIDRDNRTDEEVNQLEKSGIFALRVCSAESIYYCSDAIAAVARRQAESLGRETDKMVEAAKRSAFDVLNEDGLAERMAARRCERIVRKQVLSQMPDWKSIEKSQDINLTISSPCSDEVVRFKKLVTGENLDAIFARYPLRESHILDAIANTLELSKTNYKQTLLSRIRDDAELAEKLKQRIEPLSNVLMPQPAMSEITDNADYLKTLEEVKKIH